MESRIRKYVAALSCLVLTAIFYAGFSAKKIEAYQTNPALGNTDAGRNRVLLWVYNVSVTGISNGDVVEYADGSVADGLEVQKDSDGDSRLVAGVAISSTPTTSWGFIQTHGYHSAIRISVANSAGDALSTTTTLGQAKVDNTAGFDQFAVALEATTSSTTVKGFIMK